MRPSDVLEADVYIRTVAADAERLIGVLDGIDPATHVPTCPAWVVRDLVVHQGGIHRWAAGIVANATTERRWMNIDELGGAPADADLAGWFREGVDMLTNALADAPDDLECFMFVEAPTSKLHWARRQAHETAIHRIDAETVAGARTGFAADFAADGLDELVVGFWQRPRRGPRSDVPTRVAIAPTDADRCWTATFDADTFSPERGPAHTPTEADATATGAASDLYAWAWKRPAIGRVVIDGAPAAIGRLLGEG